MAKKQHARKRVRQAEPGAALLAVERDEAVPEEAVVSWAIAGGNTGQLLVSRDGGADVLVAAGVGERTAIDWLKLTSTYRFAVLDDATGAELAVAIVPRAVQPEWQSAPPAQPAAANPSPVSPPTPHEAPASPPVTSIRTGAEIAAAYRRLVAESSSTAAFLALEAEGLHVTGVGSDAPIPAVSHLGFEPWAGSPVSGLDFRLTEQLALLDRFATYRFEYDALPRVMPPEANTFQFHNEEFSGADATTLYALLRLLKPRLVLSMGGEWARRLINVAVHFNTATRVVCTNPDLTFTPGFVGDGVQMEHVPFPAREAPPELFAALQDGDILFLDTSHLAYLGSDVEHLILNVLPGLNPGVYVHFHDIYLPEPYPRVWYTERQRFWNEQDLLHAFLLGNRDFEIVLAHHYLERTEPRAQRRVFPNAPWWGGSSFWIRKKAATSGEDAG